MPTFTSDQKEMARKAARARKEAARREEIRSARRIAETVAIPPDVRLDADQRRRALNAPPGLRNGALKRWILEGKDGRAQQDEARGAREQKVREEVRARRSRAAKAGARPPKSRLKDPDASALAAEAKALPEAEGFRSGIRGAEARSVMNLVKQKDPLTVAGVPASRLRSFAAGEKDPALRSRMAGLSRELDGVYGRKMALLLLALAARR